MQKKFISEDRRTLIWQGVALLFVIVVILAEFWFIKDARYLSDESFNFRQISRLLNGDFSLEPTMNAIPGYHALIAALMFLFHKTGLFTARLLSAGIGLISVFVFYQLTWKLYFRPSLTRTLQYAFFPLLFPFFPLVYMDILGVLLVLLAFYLVQWKLYTLSGVVAILSVLARTNNISWVAFLFVYIYYENYGFDWKAILRAWRQTWVYWLGFGLFMVFVLVNGGVAISAKDVQPLGRFQLGNLYFLLFLVFFLFLPMNIANAPRVLTLLRKHRWIWLAVVGLYLLYLVTFQSNHPFNLARPDYYWRNGLLMAVTSNLFLKTIFFLPVLYALLSLGVTRLCSKSFYWLYPFTFLGLVPFWLIEPRYSMVPLSLFLLFKEPRSDRLEWATIAGYFLVSTVLVYLMRWEIMFI